MTQSDRIANLNRAVEIFGELDRLGKAITVQAQSMHALGIYDNALVAKLIGRVAELSAELTKINKVLDERKGGE